MIGSYSDSHIANVEETNITVLITLVCLLVCLSVCLSICLSASLFVIAVCRHTVCAIRWCFASCLYICQNFPSYVVDYYSCIYVLCTHYVDIRMLMLISFTKDIKHRRPSSSKSILTQHSSERKCDYCTKAYPCSEIEQNMLTVFICLELKVKYRNMKM